MPEEKKAISERRIQYLKKFTVIFSNLPPDIKAMKRRIKKMRRKLDIKIVIFSYMNKSQSVNKKVTVNFCMCIFFHIHYVSLL